MRTLVALLLALLTSTSALVSSAAASVAMPSSATPTTLPRSASLSTDIAARVVVRFAASATASQKAAVVASVGGVIDQEILALGLVRIAVPADGSDSYGDGPAIADAIAKQPGVISAEFDATLRLQFAPNDQYYVNDPFVGLGQWGIRTAKVDKAWDLIRASAMTIAVIDTGVDPGHPDLAGALLPGRAFLSAPSSTCTNVTSDDNSHGTHVSGIIAANGNNGSGIAGVAFGTKILPLKALDCEGAGLISDIAQAVIYAADQGVRIINVSLGSVSDGSTMRSAIQYATSRGALVVVAAGNCGATPLGARCTSQNEVSYPGRVPRGARGGRDGPRRHARDVLDAGQLRRYRRAGTEHREHRADVRHEAQRAQLRSPLRHLAGRALHRGYRGARLEPRALAHRDPGARAAPRDRG